MVGAILRARFWAVVAARDQNGRVHIMTLQADDEPSLQEQLIGLQTHVNGMEVLSDYSKISLT